MFPIQKYNFGIAFAYEYKYQLVKRYDGCVHNERTSSFSQSKNELMNCSRKISYYYSS